MWIYIFFLVIFSSVIGSAQIDSLKVGDLAPSFNGYDQDSNFINSDSILKKGKIVLVFYRGAWCPVCKKHLSSLQDSVSYIQDVGAQLLVVSPEKYASQQKMIEYTGAKYPILYDKDYRIMKMFKVDFEISKETVPRYLPFVKSRTRKANENKDDILPIPATYIIDIDGEILYKHWDKDYKKRASVKKIVSYL